MRYLTVFLALVSMVFTPISVGAEKIPRVVTVTILVDSEHNTHNDIFVKIGNAFSSAIQKFRKEFAIEFWITGLEKWDPGSNKFDAAKELRRLELVVRKSDLMIAFTTKSFFVKELLDIDDESEIREADVSGLTVVLGNCIIVRVGDKTELFLIHELGHIFGANHSLDPNSVMHQENIKSSNFDEKSKKAILTNFNRQFR